MMLGNVALTGCNAGYEPAAAPTDAASRAHTLWQDRTAHVGDNSNIVALTADAGFGSMGTHTLALHSAATPYAVTYSALHKPFDTVDVTHRPRCSWGRARTSTASNGATEHFPAILLAGPDLDSAVAGLRRQLAAPA